MPITIRVVPSRLARGGELLLALAVVALLLGYAAPWLMLLGVLWLALLAGYLSRAGVKGELCLAPREGLDGQQWRWRGSGGEWRDISLRCRYLGPWLIGLELDARALWLWPDSSDRESLRRLRHWLVQHG